MRPKKSFMIVVALVAALVLTGAVGGVAEAKTTSPLTQTLTSVKSKVAGIVKMVKGKVAGLTTAKTKCLNGNVVSASLGKNKKGKLIVSYAKKDGKTTKVVTKEFGLTDKQYNVGRDRSALYKGATVKVCTTGNLNAKGSVALKGNLINLNPNDGDTTGGNSDGGGGSGGGDNGQRDGTGAIGG